MNHREGMTCQPEIGTNPDGSTFYDVENATVTQGRHTPSGNFELDSYQDEQGQTHYEQVSDPEMDGFQTADDQIMEGLLELFPDHQEALHFALKNQPIEIAKTYNEAIDKNDWGTAVPLLEQFVQEYREFARQPQNDLEHLQKLQQEERFNDIESEAYNEFDEAYDPEDPEGFTEEEQADRYDFENAAQNAERFGDQLGRDVNLILADMMTGDVDAETAMGYLMEHYDQETIIQKIEELPDYEDD